MKIRPMPRWLTRSSRIASTCSWTVTSSAEVGSSAISRSGSPASIIAIITRWPMPPDSSCGQARATRLGSRIRTAASSSQNALRAARPRSRSMIAQASSICAPTRITGLSEYFGSCRTMPMRPPRSVAPLRAGGAQQVDARELEPVGADAPAAAAGRIIARPIVDLPEPLSPTMPSFSRPTVSETPRTASTRPDAGREGDAQVLDRQHAAVVGRPTTGPSSAAAKALA